MDKTGKDKVVCDQCGVCLDDWICPNARQHEYDTVYVASNNVARFNRKTRRGFAARANYLRKQMRKEAQ